MTYGEIQHSLAKERAPASDDIRSKYLEKKSVTLVKNNDFFARALALASSRLV